MTFTSEDQTELFV